MASTESECVEVDEPEIEQVDGRKNEETTWSVTSSRIVIDCYKDNAVLYDKSHQDYGNKVVTKKMFAPWRAKMTDNTITYIKKRWHTLRSSLLRYMKKPEEEVKWLSRVSFVCSLVCTITGQCKTQTADCRLRTADQG